MEPMVKAPKKRLAKWAECKWCKARGMSIVFRSGKRKCLEKHMVVCKTDYLLENEVASRTDSHDLVRTVALLSQRVVELEAQAHSCAQKGPILHRARQLLEQTDPKTCMETRKREHKAHPHCVFEQLQAAQVVQKSMGMAFRLLCVEGDRFA